MSSFRRKRGNVNLADFERAVLTDTAPADVPIVFSNDGFHANLIRRPVSSALREIVRVLIRSNDEKYTVPYRYRIRLTNTASRQLSLAHPAAQHRATSFYKSYSHLLPYFCGHKGVSLRRPAKVGSTFFYLNRTAERKRYKGAAIDMLLQDKTIRNPGSFFAYEGYDRFYKFFNSAEFVDLEKMFSMMRLTDVSKCFSSIYSHTLAWAVKDVQHGKEATAAISFANEFDKLMQFSNYNETNGIPVGAELSRIFAEIILQSVDSAVLRKLGEFEHEHNIDFAVRRYVDDYLIFANDPASLDLIQRVIADCLLLFNLHLNEAKTLTIARPLQTRRSQIISGAMPAVQKFRDGLQEFLPGTQIAIPKKIGLPESLTRTFVNDVKVACTNGEAGYEDVSPFIVGSIGSTIESLIGSYGSAPSGVRSNGGLYARAFDALLSSLFYFFVVHSTVTGSYQVAKSTILAVRFFKDNIPEASEYVNERIRVLIQEAISNPSLSSIAMTDCVPIEMLNIVLASSVLPSDYRPHVYDIVKRVVLDGPVDYFSVVSLLFYVGKDDPSLTRQLEKKLRDEFLPKAMPLRNSHDSHMLLDLIGCSHLSKLFRRECAETLLKGLNLSVSNLYSNVFLAEMERFPWFVDWRQIDLLNHLRKKELRPIY